VADPAQLGAEDVVTMRALAEAIVDGVAGDTSSPAETLMKFAIANDMSIELLILQMAQFMRLRDEECTDLATIANSGYHRFD
jgi:hypothetical protein